MVQTGSNRPLTEEARVLSPASPCDIGGGESDTGTGFYSTDGFPRLLRSNYDSYSSTSTCRSDLKHKRSKPGNLSKGPHTLYVNLYSLTV
jgi:hypothetical protein